jgi:CelD/BcsL family acetyltransferase involved in cellulose biosynthesis
VKIENVKASDLAEWERTWRDCSYATYFQSLEWAELWREYTNGAISPVPKVIEFSDGKKALLPLSMHKGFRGWTSMFFSSPARTFGGWISTDPLTPEHIRQLVDHMQRRLGNIEWRMNPYDDTLKEVNFSPTFKDHTHAIGLEKGYENIKKDWSKGHRSAVTKAEREGVSVRTAQGEEDWRDYFSAYEDSLRRWGEKATSRYEWKFFEEMQKKDSQYIRLWLAVYDDKVIAGALCFYSARHIVYWHGATREEHFKLRPSNLVVAKAIEDGCERGFKWFDFNPSGGHEGVAAFKRSFGALEYPCDVFVRKTLTSKIMEMALRCYQSVKK